jgi:MFS family permease
VEAADNNSASIGAEFRTSWTLLAGATMGAIVGIAALPFYTFGIFMAALESQEHWARTEISLAQTLWAGGLALASPFVGGLIDRYGHRLPIAISFAAIVLSFLTLSQWVETPHQFIAVYAVMAVFGAASSPLPFAKIVAARFERGRGIALGITLAGTGISAFAAPLYLSPLIAHWGWRGGYLGMACLIIVLAPLALWLLGRPTPTRRAAAVITVATGLSVGEALRRVTFWQLCVIFFLVTLGSSGLVAHLVPLLKSAGQAPARAASIVSTVGLSVVAGRLTIGALIDRFQVRFVAAGAFFLTATGCLLLWVDVKFAWLAALGVGFALGTEVDMMGYCTARFFGFKRYGVLYGSQYGLTIVGVATSPVWMGALSQRHGYPPVLEVAVGVTALAALLSLALPRTPPPASA